MNFLRLQGFTLFEALLAWSLFVSTVAVVALAQTRALNALRGAYLNEVAAIQVLNIKNRLMALKDDSLRDSTYNLWHQHNLILFNDATDHYTCADQSCCVDLNWAKHAVQTCFNVS